VEVQPHAFIISALDGSEHSASRPCRFTSCTHSRGGWVGTRASLEAVAKRKRPYTAPAGNQTPVVQPVGSGSVEYRNTQDQLFYYHNKVVRKLHYIHTAV